MKYVGKKFVTLIITLLLISFLVFLTFDIIPGDAAMAQLGTEATPERLEALREERGESAIPAEIWTMADCIPAWRFWNVL